MEEAKYYELERWGWDCSCGHWNEAEDDPNYMDTIECEKCNKECKPVQA
jgi:hypothetical protein